VAEPKRPRSTRSIEIRVRDNHAEHFLLFARVIWVHISEGVFSDQFFRRVADSPLNGGA